MRKNWKSFISVFLSLCMILGGIYYIPQISKAADAQTNVANGRNNYTFMTSNANTPVEGFLYVGNGFSAINCCNENLGNGNNLLGQTATTKEAAVYVDLGRNYDISSALIYQGSTNSNFYDSYCRKYSIYYSKEQVSAANEGNIPWELAGVCENGTIYNGASTKIKNAEYTSSTGDAIAFNNTVTARSVKIVFDKEACMGTGNNGNNTGTTGTVSLLSVRVYGVENVEETTTEYVEPDENLYGSYTDDLALSKKGYASSNLRQNATSPVTVNNLTNGNTTAGNYIIANTTGGDTNPWFAVDLGQVYDINKVTVTPGANDTYPNAYPIEYKVQVAVESRTVSTPADIGNLTWTTVATVTDGTLAEKSITFPRKNSRYIRILADRWADYCSLYELSVFGTDDSYLLEEEENTMKVLFVGNSMTYYNNLCKVVEGFARLQGKKIQCTASTQGGKNLIFHTTYSQTISEIQSGKYDVVILQDIVGSFNGEELMQGATTLNRMIKEYNPEAKVILYMPWPTQDTLTGEDSKLPYFTHHYIKTARSLGAALAPAGEAWYTVLQQYPERAWYTDGKHPHAIGTFVSACAIYYALFPEAEKVVIDSANQSAVNEIINNNIAYSGDAVTQYDAELLNFISNYGYYYTHQVEAAVADQSGQTEYQSVAGNYSGPYTVTVDGIVQGTYHKDSKYTLGDAAYGYYALGKMYPAGYQYTVKEDVEFTSVNELSVSMSKGAGIKTTTPAGLRYQAKITSENMSAVSAQDAITEGILITTQDIFENNGSTLDLTSSYDKINVKNSGWYGVEGTYCGAVANIVPENYSRDFVARAYVTVNYIDDTTYTIYSEMSDVRSVQYVAKAVKADNYRGLSEQEREIVDSFLVED